MFHLRPRPNRRLTRLGPFRVQLVDRHAAREIEAVAAEIAVTVAAFLVSEVFVAAVPALHHGHAFDFLFRSRSASLRVTSAASEKFLRTLLMRRLHSTQ
jgi:hypothetical protein